MTSSNGVAFRIRSLPFDRPGADPLVVQVAASTQPLDRRVRTIAAGLLAAIVAVLTLAAVGSLHTVRRALAPVDAIIDRVKEIQRTGPDRRLDIRAGSAELDRLVSTLNDMLGGIEGSVRSSRRFAADASHELQTPLAAMRAAVESCLLDTTTSGAQTRMAEDRVAEIDRCSAVVRDLRLLALADAGRLLMTVETVDLATLATECVEIARTLAEPERVGVALEIGDHPSVRGSALHLRRVVLNLATNAIRYSTPDSIMRVRVERAPDAAARIVVTDHGWRSRRRISRTSSNRSTGPIPLARGIRAGPAPAAPSPSRWRTRTAGASTSPRPPAPDPRSRSSCPSSHSGCARVMAEDRRPTVTTAILRVVPHRNHRYTAIRLRRTCWRKAHGPAARRPPDRP